MLYFLDRDLMVLVEVLRRRSGACGCDVVDLVVEEFTRVDDFRDAGEVFGTCGRGDVGVGGCWWC